MPTSHSTTPTASANASALAPRYPRYIDRLQPHFSELPPADALSYGAAIAIAQLADCLLMEDF